MEKHWTERTIKDFRFRAALDFIELIETRLKELKLSPQDLASKLNVSESGVSKLFNDPGNLTLDTMIKLSRVLGMKFTTFPYFDGDPGNERGPIFPDIFLACWEKCGKPVNFFQLESDEDSNLEIDAAV